MDTLHRLAREVAQLRSIADAIEASDKDVPLELIERWKTQSAEVCDVAEELCFERGLSPARRN